VEAAGGRGPTALVTAANGAVWLASYASNVIVRVDPVTLKQDAVVLPAGVLGPKSIAVDAGGRVWLAAFRSGRVLRYDPRRRAWDGWALERGAKPYALAIEATGGVLVTDTGHDRLLRLDPASGAQTEVARLSERGQARGMASVGASVWITEAAADRLSIVETAAPSQ
jgi:streptogramin lyase